MKTTDDPSIETQFAQAKKSVTEIELKNVEHERKIEQCEEKLRLLQTRSPEERLNEQAAAFFGNGDDAGTQRENLRAELRRLYDERELFAVEIKRRNGIVEGLRGRWSRRLWDTQFAARDLEIKQRLAKHLTALAEAAADEIGLTSEIFDANAQPPAQYRPMRPASIGILSDPNSFVSLWLRELKTYYPTVKG